MRFRNLRVTRPEKSRVPQNWPLCAYRWPCFLPQDFFLVQPKDVSSERNEHRASIIRETLPVSLSHLWSKVGMARKRPCAETGAHSNWTSVELIGLTEFSKKRNLNNGIRWNYSVGWISTSDITIWSTVFFQTSHSCMGVRLKPTKRFKATHLVFLDVSFH